MLKIGLVSVLVMFMIMCFVFFMVMVFRFIVNFEVSCSSIFVDIGWWLFFICDR